MIAGGSALDFYIEERRAFFDSKRPQGRNLQTGWRASSLGTCLRAQAAERLGIPKTRTIDAKTRRAFQWGDEMHRFAKRFHYHLGIVKGDETRFYDSELDLSGHVDLIIGGPVEAVEDIPAEFSNEWSPEWLEFLAYLREKFAANYADQLEGITGKEIKSAKSYAMERMADEGPQDSWKVQVGAYWLLAERNPQQLEDQTGLSAVDNWVVEAIGKDSVGVLTFGAVSSWRDDALERVRRLHGHYLAGLGADLLDCECQGWQVEFCSYGLPADASSKGKLGFTCCDGAGKYERRKKAGE